MTRAEAINYLTSTGLTEEQVMEVVEALRQEPCDVPDINAGDIYECPCGYGWDKSKVVRHHFCPNCGRAVGSSYNSIKPELKPCEDAVSRNLITQTLNKMDRYVAEELTLCDTDKKFPKNEVFIVDDVYEEIVEQLPSVNPQPKTGHWEWVQYDSNPNVGNWHCSECRCIVVIGCGYKKSKGDIPLYKYCPQCGCRIVEPQESEDKE